MISHTASNIWGALQEVGGRIQGIGKIPAHVAGKLDACSHRGWHAIEDSGDLALKVADGDAGVFKDGSWIRNDGGNGVQNVGRKLT